MATPIKWNKHAIHQLDEAIFFIQTDSPDNAEKVKKDILIAIDILSKYPEKYSPDKYKTNNDGSFRALEIHRYRISYRYKDKEIRIIRIRHSKMNPLEY